MTMTKFNIEKFNGKNDFSIWRLKMKALLVHQGIIEALTRENNLQPTMSEEKKREIVKKAYSALILSLEDKPLKEVAKKKITTTIWLKLENLYMTKSLADKLNLKQKLYIFKMQTGRYVDEQIDEFNKIIIDIENIDMSINVED